MDPSVDVAILREIINQETNIFILDIAKEKLPYIAQEILKSTDNIRLKFEGEEI
jgi:hypothetical protein